MKTVYQTGPGFYAAATDESDKTIQPDVLRVHCIRMEAYDIPANDASADAITFDLVFAKAETDPRIARALLLLGQTIDANKQELKRFAK